MRKPRGSGNPGDDGVAGNAHQPEKQPAHKGRPLIKAESGPIVAAVVTAASSLLIYALAQVNHIDERLDRLEQEARVLLDGDGAVRPSREAMQSYFSLEHLKERVAELERLNRE